MQQESFEHWPENRAAHRCGFTLIELLVVIGIIIVMLSVMAPALKSMMRNNSRTQAVNMVRANLSAARSVAISQHRQAGLVFFEETAKYAPTPNTGQTAMQLIVEDPIQDRPEYLNPVNTGAPPKNTVFIYYSRDREYLPAGIQVAALNDVSSRQIITADITTGSATRVVLFDANGQLMLRNGIARPDLGSAPTPPNYPYSYGDWNLTTKNGTASDAISTPGAVVFSMKDYVDAGMPAATDSAKATWIQQHSDILVVNAYTGNLIR